MKTQITLLLIIFPLLMFSQDLNKIDSLRNSLKFSVNDSNKVMLLVELTKAIKNNDISSAKRYNEEALKISQKIKFEKGKFKAWIQKISILRIEFKDSIALKESISFVKDAENLKNIYFITAGYINLGEVYDNNGDNKKAMEYALKGLSFAEKLGKKDLLQDSYASLQRIYFSRSEFDKAIHYGKKAIVLAEEMKDEIRVMSQSYNLAFTYNITGDFNQSIIIAKKVIKIAKKLKDRRVETYALYNLCSVNLRIDKLSEALYYGKQCLDVSKKISDKSIQASALAALGSISLQQGDNKAAENYLTEALQLKNQLDDKLGISEVKSMLANVYFAIGQPKKAYSLSKEAEEFSDKYNQSILDQQSSELEKKYETEKKDNQIKLQQSQIRQKNILNYVLIGSALALGLILVLSYRNYNHRKKLQQQKITELETEKQLLATQSLLKGQEEERSRLAKDLHDGLGGLLSGVKLQLGAMKGNLILSEENAIVFDRALIKLDESIREMRRVAHNMMPESLVKSGLKDAISNYCESLSSNQKFKINCELHGIDKKLTGSTDVVIYRIIQELINNAVKHSDATEILVQVFRDENKNISITVEDNGKGFDAENLNNTDSDGIKNLKSRVNYLRGTMDIKSEIGKGTSVFIECKEEQNG